jgi:ATP-dependent DNA helicase DinG
LAGTRIPASTLARTGAVDDPVDGPDSGGGSDPAPVVAEPVGFELGLEPLPVIPRRSRATTDGPTGGTPGGATGGVASSTGTPSLGEVVALADGRVSRLVGALRDAGRDGADAGSDADTARRDRAVLAAGHLTDDLRALGTLDQDQVAWVDGGARNPVLRVSPIEVGPILSERLWGDVSAVLTSATVPLGLAGRLGLDPDGTEELDVGSPFDYEDHAMLYVAKSLPDRRRPEAEPALIEELVTLMTAAGGRTLALFTSWRAMTKAVEEIRERVPFPVLAQSDLPKPALVEAFRSDEATCLFATLGFWQGVDVPGRTLSLVTIDRIPFPRPDEPVLQARRDRAGDRAFRLVDLPRAGTLLAQGAGRLIRSTGDRGVVAVLDSRLATASYRSELLARVPPMRRSIDRDDVVRFLREITGG